jgi:hypothetical protein
MPQFSGPVGPGPLDPYYTNDTYEKEQAAQKAAVEQQAQQKLNTPKSVNPIQGAVNVVGDVFKPITQTPLGAKVVKNWSKDTSFAAESNRVILNTGVGVIEDTLNTADLVGDILKVGASKLTGKPITPTEDPWSDRYTAAAYSFGLEKPKTQVGQAAAKISQLILLTRAAAKALPKAFVQLGTKGVGVRGAVASGIVPGAVADFMLTKPEDGNFSEMVKNFVPEDNPLHNSFLFGLATDRNDDVFTAKIKGTLEGGVFNAVSDGLIWMAFGRKAAQAAIRAGATQEEALAKGLAASQSAMKAADKAYSSDVTKEATRWGEVHQLEIEELSKMEARLISQEEAYRAANLSDTDPQVIAVREALSDVRMSQAELDERIVNGYDPSDAKSHLPQDASANVKEGDPVRAIADQHESFSGNTGKIGGFGDTMPTAAVRGATHMMTDAQYRIQNITGDAQEVVRNISSRFDLQQAAAAARDSVDGIIRSAAEELDNFRSALGGDISEQNMLSMMKQAELIDPENTTGRLLSKKGILVTKALIRDTALQINDLATNAVALREAGQLPGNSIDRLVDRMVTLLDFHKYTAYKTGSTLQIFQRVVGLGDDVLDEAKNAAKNELTNQEIRDWALRIKRLQRSSDPKAADELDAMIRALVLAGGDPTKMVTFWGNARSIGFKQAINGMYQSMLSGPITHLRNIFGNTYSLIERPFSAFVVGDKAVKASAVAGMHGIVTGFQDAWKVALTTLKTGDSVNFNHKFVVDDFETRALLEQMNLAARTDAEKIAAGILEKSYNFQNNPWLSWPSRSLMAGDDFFKSLAARYRMNSKAMYEAKLHSVDEASEKDLFDMYLKQYSKGIDPQTGRINDPDLLAYAERITFQQDPGSFINTIANAIDQSPGGVGKLFIPFVRTPANLLGYGLEHVPGIHKVMRSLGDTLEAAEKSGDLMLVAEIKGRQATGAMLVGSMVTMAMMTDITGNVPYDNLERQAWKEEGRPPMSIKIGDKWVSYAALEPVNSMLSIVADAMRLVKIGGADAAGNIMRQLAYSITAGYTDKSFLAGLSSIGQLLDPKNMNDPGMMNLAWNTTNNFLPYAGARRALSNSLDPYLKETRSELDRILVAALPGYGKDVPSVTSWITGQKLNSIGGGIWNAGSPIRLYDVNDNFVVKTMTDIKFPSNAILKTGQNGIKLEPEQRERLAQLLFKSGLNKKLDTLFRDKAWQAMAKQWKGRPITSEMVLGEKEDAPPHIKKVKEFVSAYKNQALAVLFQEDPTYRAQVFQTRDQEIRAYQGDFRPSNLEQLQQFAKQ